jgi:hypothetical protein
MAGFEPATLLFTKTRPTPRNNEGLHESAYQEAHTVSQACLLRRPRGPPGGPFHEKASLVKPDVAGRASASNRFARLPFALLKDPYVGSGAG